MLEKVRTDKDEGKGEVKGVMVYDDREGEQKDKEDEDVRFLDVAEEESR